ncbi:MAG: Crp/Fnr family transcriptional regulator [Schleiferiaceae bacterium]
MEYHFPVLDQTLSFDEYQSAILLQRAQVETLAAGKHILRAQQTPNRIYLLMRGMVRTYYHHNDKEITSWFYAEQQVFTSWSSFYTQSPTHEYIETLEECELYSMDFTTFQELMEKDGQFQKFGRLLAEEQTTFIDFFYKGYMYMTAKEKLELLRTYFPGIELRVKLSHISSFLGITPETLSRIRSL